MRRYKIIKEEIYCDEDFFYQIIRNNIRNFRIEERLTQQELADLCGLSRGYICDIENDKKNKHFSINTLIKISCALNKDIRNFFQ